MPIIYTPSDRSFHIMGKTFSYCLFVNDEGQLLNLHWGKRLPDARIGYLLESYWGGASFDMRVSRLPFEVPTQGTGWYGTPALRVRNAQGDDVVALRYLDHEIIKGKPALQGLPQAYTEREDEVTTLEIALQDELTGLRVRLRYSVYEELDVLIRSMFVENGSEEALTLEGMLSASVPLYGSAYDLMHLKGAWARERAVVRTPLGQASTRISSARGASGHEENPFIALLAPEATEFAGDVRGMTLIYSGSFMAHAEVDNFDNTRMGIGLNPDAIRWLLGPGESFQCPEAVLAYSGEGLNGMSQRFHRLIRERVCRGAWRDRPRPILINNWEGTYFDFDEQKLVTIATAAKKIGVELFVLDDGWFGKRNSDNCSLGDWWVNREKLPGGIRGIAERIEALGLRFGLWFEPEMVSPDSDLYRAHPDWCLHVDGRPRTEARQQLILDLSRREVQDYIIESVANVLGGAPISYVKWDMNRNMTEAFSAQLPPERRMETQHRYMLGLYRVLEALTSAFPEVLFESCSGGGGRFDAGMLYYMPQTWTSDDTDAVERLGIQYGTSIVYPPSAMGAHVSACPNHQTGRTTSLDMRAKVALGGNFGFELDLTKMSEEELHEAAAVVSRVKALRDTVQRGKFTRLESPFAGNFTAWQFLSEDESRVILCAYQKLAMPNPTCKRFYLKGLDEEAEYIEQETGMRLSGAALMYAGLPVPPARSDFAGHLHVFERRK